MKVSSADGVVPARGSGLGVKDASRLFFAYGSNMNTAQVRARCGSQPRALGPARLPGYRMAFYGQSKKWDGAQETLDREPAGEVWGVVYALDFGAAEKLDGFQDVRMDGAGAYFHYPTEVVTASGEKLEVVLYKKDQAEEPGEPSREYLGFILEGAEEHGLPAAYIEQLKATPSHPARYEVPRRSKYDDLMGVGCTKCGDLRASKGGPGLNVVADSDDE